MDELNQTVLKWIDGWMPDFLQSKHTWTEYRKKLLANAIDTHPPTGTQVCTYMFKRGKRTGEACGVSVRGGKFCSKHKTVTSVAPEVFTLDLNKIKDESDDDVYSSSEEHQDTEVEENEDDGVDELDEEDAVDEE